MIAIWVDVKTIIPFLGTLNTRCRTIIRIHKGTIILTTAHMIARASEKKKKKRANTSMLSAQASQGGLPSRSP